MTKHKKPSGQGRLARITVLSLIAVILFIGALMYALGSDVTLLNPKGLIAQEQFHLMLFSAMVMLCVAVPTLTLLYFFAWKYRESNSKAKHDPNARLGKKALGLWVIPFVVLLILTSVVWPATHKLDPHKALADAPPLTIQVIALRWKWVFIYPQQNIATVNFVELPTDTPVEFDLTADEAPMSSFWIPHLGGQLYAMTGHDNHLNLMATTPGDYNGRTAEINGPGFEGMKFTARASSPEGFNQWVQSVKQSSIALDSLEYKRLLTPSENEPAKFYSSAELNLYPKVLLKYGASHGGHAGWQ